MSKVAPFSPFRLEDFPTERPWIGTLFLALNNVLSQMSDALNGKITAGDNIPTFTKVLSGSNLTVPLTFKADDGFTAAQMVIAQAVKAGSPIVMAGSWSQSGDTITVNKLFEMTETGNLALVSGTKYTIVLRFT